MGVCVWVRVCTSAVNFLICPAEKLRPAPPRLALGKTCPQFNSNKNVAEMKFVTFLLLLFFVVFIYKNLKKFLSMCK